jgi:methyl-accepting chemotaxis protein
MELREFTSAMSDATNSYTRSTTDNISEFNRTLTAACKSFEALSKTVLDSNALIASKINTDLVTKPISELERCVERFTLIAERFSSFGNHLSDSLTTTQKTLSSFDSAMKEASRSSISLNDGLDAISSGAQITSKSLQIVSTASGELGASLSALSDKSHLSQGSLEDLNNVTQQLQSRLDDIVGRFEAFADNVSATVPPLDRLKLSMNEASVSSQEVGRSITPFNTSIKAVSASLESMKESSSNYTDEMRKLLESFSQIREELNVLKSTINGNR